MPDTHLPKLALSQIPQSNVSDDTQAYETPEQSEELGSSLGSCFPGQASACRSPSQGSKAHALDKRADFIITIPIRKPRQRSLAKLTESGSYRTRAKSRDGT